MYNPRKPLSTSNLPLTEYYKRTLVRNNCVLLRGYSVTLIFYSDENLNQIEGEEIQIDLEEKLVELLKNKDA